MRKKSRRSAWAAGVLVFVVVVVGVTGVGALVASVPPRASVSDTPRPTVSDDVAGITWTLHRSPAPTEDEADAYDRIDAAMQAAASRWSRHSAVERHLSVSYVPGVPTAEASFNGDIRFGANRAHLNEFTALHEISHTLGIGQTQSFSDRCQAGDWPQATALLEMWEGPEARLNCGGGHIWPYGLNFAEEYSSEAADRHVLLIDAMIFDGLQAY